MKQVSFSFAILVFCSLVIQDPGIPRNGCNKNIAGAPDTLVYGHWDPPYQGRKNYEIRVTSNKVRLLVESWSKVLLTKTYALKEDDYLVFVKAIDSLHIKYIPVQGSPCVGSSSETLLLYPGTARQVKGFRGCGTQGTLEGDVAKAAMLFKALVPDLDKRLLALEKDD